MLAPAGTRDGHVGFITAAVRCADARKISVVVVTDRAVQDCAIARLQRVGERFVFDLAGAAPTEVTASTHHHHRRKRASD